MQIPEIKPSGICFLNPKNKLKLGELQKVEV
jgi:hypothetical protein